MRPPSAPVLERALFAAPLTQGRELLITSAVIYLCQYSHLHALYPAQKLHSRIVPSLGLDQYHYYTDEAGIPQAFCNWVWLNESVMADVLANNRDLAPHEFRCGDLPFFYEMLAPFGHCRAVVRNLRNLPYFRGRRIPAIRGQVWPGEAGAQRVVHFQF